MVVGGVVSFVGFVGRVLSVVCSFNMFQLNYSSSGISSVRFVSFERTPCCLYHQRVSEPGDFRKFTRLCGVNLQKLCRLGQMLLVQT